MTTATLRRTLGVLLLMLLTACAPIPTAPAPQLGPPVSHFAAEARVALRQGERSDHLRLHWRHSPHSDHLLLMSPLGQGLAELSRDAHGARLTQPGQPPRHAADLGQLAQDLFGTALPLAALTEWMRGARPELAGEVDGWRVRITDTVLVTNTAKNEPSRQRRLLRSLEASQGDIQLRLVIDDWEASDD